MEQSTIIKLRQQEASSITTNGSFSTALQNKVLQNDDDSGGLNYVDQMIQDRVNIAGSDMTAFHAKSFTIKSRLTLLKKRKMKKVSRYP